MWTDTYRNIDGQEIARAFLQGTALEVGGSLLGATSARVLRDQAQCLARDRRTAA
jgi:hypothetical protein